MIKISLTFKSLKGVFLLKNVLLYFVFTCMCVYNIHAVPDVARGGYQNWSYTWLWAVTWVLGIQSNSWSCARAASILRRSLQSPCLYFLMNILNLCSPHPHKANRHTGLALTSWWRTALPVTALHPAVPHICHFWWRNQKTGVLCSLLHDHPNVFLLLWSRL